MILFCEVPPPEGGETPFIPSFRVTERMLEEYPEVEALDEKGVIYTFTALSKNDTSSMRGRGWEDALGTADRIEAEKRYVSVIYRDLFIRMMTQIQSVFNVQSQGTRNGDKMATEWWGEDDTRSKIFNKGVQWKKRTENVVQHRGWDAWAGSELRHSG